MLALHGVVNSEPYENVSKIIIRPPFRVASSVESMAKLSGGSARQATPPAPPFI